MCILAVYVCFVYFSACMLHLSKWLFKSAESKRVLIIPKDMKIKLRIIIQLNKTGGKSKKRKYIYLIYVHNKELMDDV